MIHENLFLVISKNFRESVREKLFYGELTEVSDLILIGFILVILLVVQIAPQDSNQ